MRIKTSMLAKTALMLALLLAIQFSTKGFTQIVTGSLVNMILVMTYLLLGLGSASIVAALSPFCAFFLGIGPAVLALVPFIALGNLIQAAVMELMRKLTGEKYLFLGVFAAAVAKFAVLYCLVVLVMLPMLNIPDAQAAKIVIMFTWPQLLTALIGGTSAYFLSIPVKRALENRE